MQIVWTKLCSMFYKVFRLTWSGFTFAMSLHLVRPTTFVELHSQKFFQSVDKTHATMQLKCVLKPTWVIFLLRFRPEK